MSEIRIAMVCRERPSCRLPFLRLGFAGGLEVVGWYQDVSSVLAERRSRKPRVLIVHATTRGLDGPSCVAQLAKEVPTLPVIIVCEHVSERSLFAALAVGAAGYLVPPCNAPMMLKAVNEALAGRFALCRKVKRVLGALWARMGAVDDGPGQLTAREREIVALVAAGGAGAKDAALSLGISCGTVRRHLANIYKKLGVHSARDVPSSYLNLE